VLPLPALTFDFGDRVWWASRLWRREGYPGPQPEPDEPPPERAAITPKPAAGQARS
jgi:hypothetical protein